LSSALAQTYKNFDITVVNDGSTDCSRRVLQETIDRYTEVDRINRERFLAEADGKGLVGPPRWALWDTYYPNGERVAPKVIDQENKGLSESRNIGIRSGDGEFILPLDADDWIDPRYLELTVPKMSDPKIGIVSPEMQYEGLLHNRIAPLGRTLAHEMRSNDLPICSLIRRAAFEQTKGYETIFIEVAGSSKVLGYEDWNMWIDILKRGWQVAVVNEPLFHYRVKPVSMITQAKKLHSGLVRIIHLLHPDLWPNG
jgi:glycosyltransferase involved in cell wall biosynthesis